MGIKIISGVPGEGKSYLATMIALDAMDRGMDVVANYPIYHEKSKSYCYEWHDSMFGRLKHALVIIDEAHFEFNSRDWKSFTMEMHAFFSEHRHNDLELYIISQSPLRIEGIIREITRPFIEVSCKRWPWPFNKKPLYFNADYYNTLEEYEHRLKDPPSATRTYFFSKRVAEAYDTHGMERPDMDVKKNRWYSDGSAPKRFRHLTFVRTLLTKDFWIFMIKIYIAYFIYFISKHVYPRFNGPASFYYPKQEWFWYEVV